MAKLTTNNKVAEDEQISESYISIGLGLLVVVVVGILLYNYFTQKNKSEEAAKEQEKITQEATMSAKPGTTYTVVAGDTLWSISEKSYGTGYNYQDIAKANNLSDTDALEAGQQLMIPEVTPVPTITNPSPTPTMEIAASPAPTTTTITDATYTVMSGDTLWDIACRAYGDCYAWTKIASANGLVDPDLIHPGNVFTLPR